MQLDWSLLGLDRTPDFGNIVRKGMAEGRETSRQYRQDNALAALAQRPDDDQAMAELAGIDPEAAWKFGDRKAATAKTEQEGIQAQLEARRDDIEKAARIIEAVGPQDAGGWATVRQEAQRYGIDLSEVPEQWDETTRTYADNVVKIANKLNPPKAAEKPSIAREFEYAQTQGFGGSFMDYQNSQGAPIMVDNGDGTKTLYPRSTLQGGQGASPSAADDDEWDYTPPTNGGQTQPASGNFPSVIRLDPLAPR